MATVRFKFRSSATFDSVDIGEQSSISIRDLKSKIVLKKHLNLSHDFDLVFSDSDTGLEYTDENTRISSGSSVIIKRVPAKSPPSLRCSQDPLVRCQKLEANPPYESSPRDSSANEGSTLVMPKPKFEEQTKPERSSPAKQLAMEAMENSDIPSELKCSLCRTYFKEAVMIPCCQHSFCGNCICVALSENAKCPKCSSTKCKPKDLLPNVSLREAIERFLKTQLVPNVSENDLHRDAPDGESGIQVIDFSSATIVPPRNFQLSRCGTSNKPPQIMQSRLHEHAHLADKATPDTLDEFTEFQGENDPLINAGNNEEVSCSKKGKKSHVLTGATLSGGERNFTAPGRPNKVLRTCYMCGSPDHLIRDCPGAAQCSTSHWNGVASLHGVVSSYPQPHWLGSAPPSRPFINTYAGPGMMFYNTNATPISPFAFPSYASSMYGGYPVVSEYMNMGGVTTPAGNLAQQLKNVAHQDCGNQQRDDVASERVQNIDRNKNANTHYDSTERGPYHSGDGFSRRLDGKHRSYDNSDGENLYFTCNREGKTARHLECGIDHRIAQSGRSSSDTDVHDSRIRPKEPRHEKLHRSFRKHDQKIALQGRDSIQNYNMPNKESARKKRMEHGERSSGRHSYSRSRCSLEPSYSGGDVRQRREGSSLRSRHLTKSARYNGKEMHRDHGYTKYPDDYGEDCHSHKRKRYH